MRVYEGINPFVNLITCIWCPPSTLLDSGDTVKYTQKRFKSHSTYIPMDKRDDKQTNKWRKFQVMINAIKKNKAKEGE